MFRHSFTILLLSAVAVAQAPEKKLVFEAAAIEATSLPLACSWIDPEPSPADRAGFLAGLAHRG